MMNVDPESEWKLEPIADFQLRYDWEGEFDMSQYTHRYRLYRWKVGNEAGPADATTTLLRR